METEIRPGTALITATEAQIAEATQLRQSESATLPAAQVFGEQRDSAASGLASLALVP